ncbi:MAG: cytochrome b5-like heme/steroid binding domain-containing protein [Candidatus Paceibacterota bacterium]|jgi:cytochrome b involved in lipid metabolism
MKKTVAVSLFIFFVVVTSVLVAGLVFYQNNYNNKTENFTNNINDSIKVTLDMSEIKKHNNINDCYMVMNNKVYDLTSYFGSHPGGDRAMVLYCGENATQAYATKGGEGSRHSSYAKNLLAQYLIGNLAK